MYGYVYKTTNLINGKNYIGQHKFNGFDTVYKGSGKKLKLAINKYGRDNFKTIILEKCSTPEELDNREMYWIKEYRNIGEAYYNIADGGSGNRGLFKEKNPFYGKKHSVKTRKLMSEKKKGIKGKDHPLYGRKMTAEHIKKTRRTGTKQSKETREKISDTLSKQRVCHYCGEKIKSGVALKKHIKENHQKEKNERIMKSLMETNSKIHICPYCQKKIKNKGNLTQHIRSKHDSSFKKENICYLK
ncbi:GIY-YIG homing endonuclease [Staphylococcus phage vB_SepM_BE05]|nr:GIY-YIG homing endonuclease [Staphylococcus phage vB_SepM_BE05]